MAKCVLFSIMGEKFLLVSPITYSPEHKCYLFDAFPVNDKGKLFGTKMTMTAGVLPKEFEDIPVFSDD